MAEGFIDVVGLERELRELWEQMAVKKQSGDVEAITRACVHNLIVFAPGERSDSEVNSIIAEVTVQNPGRVFILLPDSASNDNNASAWVSAQCYRPSGKREQVCCEQIMIRAKGKAVQNLPEILAPLLIPDVPVFLWWRSPLQDVQTFTDLLEYAERTIIDSLLQAASRDELQKTTAMLVQNQSLCAFSDLNWARLTIWRDSIARLFDPPMASSQFSEIAKVEIDATETISSEPLFLGCWIASRLGWKATSKIQTDNASVTFHCKKENGDTVEIKISKANVSLSGSVIQAIRIRTPGSMFSVSGAAESSYLEVSAQIGDKAVVRHARKFEPGTESDLLRKELQILGRDRSFEDVLQFLHQIL